MRILIIEDELKLSKALKSNLESEAYTVDVESDGELGLYRAKTNDYDAILLDDMLPGKRGYEICRALRSSGRMAPILLMSVQSGADRRVSLLDDGADDYLEKPFSYAEISARLRALLRRPRTMVAPTLRVGDLILDEDSSLVMRDGEAIYLTTKEFALLQYLMRHADRLVSRAMIMEHVWTADADAFSSMIETHIHNLRRKIEKAGMKKLIYTISGRGYMMKRF
jgi:DNA-binding response OmpR family regulator